MAMIYVARSVSLSKWASDVGLSKYVFKIGVTEEPLKPLITAGWAGLTDWSALKSQEVPDGTTEAAVIERLACKEKLVDPRLYPRIKGTPGIFKVVPTHVENHIVISRALAGTEESAELKLKPADFAAYMIHNATRRAATD